MRTDLARMAEAHRRTLDQLATGVAIFGSNQKLAFYNAAYRSLWDLDAGFLDQEPSDLAVLDRLRAARKLPEELFQTLVAANGVRIERIVSHGHASPEGFWYDQEQDEWVLVLQGAAKLRFEDRDEPLDMTPGCHVLIPAHTRHRVDWTDPTQITIWLAVHLSANYLVSRT